tara:strand:+ start:460 stop:735 length:276 start_codon:yes stop_codon:yes gene_type:complete
MKKEEKELKVTEEQLSKIKQSQEDIATLLRDVGFLETQKHAILHKYAGVVQDSEDYKAELEKQYGAININLEDGSYTVIEVEDKDKTKDSE